MSPTEIAELAWDRREQGIAPDITIMDALGLTDYPRYSEDPEGCWQYRDCVDAWAALFNERVPPAGPQHHRVTTIQDAPRRGRVRHVCPECGTVNWWPAWKARKHEFCGLSCAAVVRNRKRWGESEAA